MNFDELGQVFAQFIGGQTGASKVDVLDFSRLTGGAIQDNYALTVLQHDGHNPGRKELVVRSDAPSQISASLSRPQEFHVLNVAYEAGVTVPQPLWLCTDTSLIGAAFCIMSRVQGSASPRQLVRGGLTDGQAQALTHQLGTELARLHRVTPPRAELAFLHLPLINPALDRVQQYRNALASIPEPHPALEWSLNWLQDHAPESDPIVLCHCDFRTGNYMAQNGQLTAVLDWEFATWSDPYEDLGWLCAKSWRFGANDREVGGVGHKQDLFKGYASQSGKSVDTNKVLYWEVMAMTRWAIIALQQAQRHLSGEQSSLELALTGRMLPEIEFDLLNQIHALEKKHD
ncbi:MAG: phosphotransferase family protein [Burkholderiaceae bacterium]|nr:phosphotransferase family protein [Burkholderiaceae bacterium]